MADILEFPTRDDAFYRRFAREYMPERRTRDIIDDLKPLLMLGDADAVMRGVLFAELAVTGTRS